MNYRIHTPDVILSAIKIETTHKAADPVTDTYGSLKIARAHFELRLDTIIDELRELKRAWRSMPEKKLPSDEPIPAPQTPDPVAQEPSVASGSPEPTPTDGDTMPDIPPNLRRVVPRE